MHSCVARLNFPSKHASLNNPRDAAACIIYDELVLKQQAGHRAQAAPRPDTGPLPWLLYSPGTDYLESTAVGLT
jgi:hypothetical protein